MLCVTLAYKHWKLQQEIPSWRKSRSPPDTVTLYEHCLYIGTELLNSGRPWTLLCQ